MRLVRLLLVSGLLCTSTAILQAQQPAPVIVGGGSPGTGKVTKSADRPTGISSPVPPAVVGAHRVFLSHGGADAGLFPHPFTGTQDRGYGYFYNAMQADKHFELVSAPAEADVVLELQLTAPSAGIGDKKAGTEDPLPAFKLTVYDRPTHYVLWTMSQTIDKANLQRTHDKNFDMALDLLLRQWQLATGQTLPPLPKPASDTTP